MRALVLLLPGLTLLAGPVAQPPGAAEKLLYLLEYVAADYGHAVRDGAIVDAYEYVEMLTISRTLVEQADELVRHGAPADVGEELAGIREAVLERDSPAAVRARARGLALALFERLDAISLPAAAPDLARAQELYTAGCEPCHGATGGGDGRAAPGMEPPPVSFRGPRMNLVSPHQMYVAIASGIEHTAMPAYTPAYTPAESWDLAFFVLTLREGFAPRAPDVELPFTLRELALSANDELLERARKTWPAAQPAHVDHCRSAE